MKSKLTRVVVISLSVMAAFVLASSDGAPNAKATHETRLQAPPFLSEASARAESAALSIGEKLDDEAGISAWCQTAGAIDLNLVADQYQIIETQTDSYILGSVSAPGYIDDWDQHVYVHADGWIVAYYMNTDVTGRIVNLRERTIESTLVENMVNSMAGEASTSCIAASLYDFRFPNATKMLFIAENDADGATYTINMPLSYEYMERSWAKWNDGGYCDFRIDGVQLTAIVNLGEYCIGPVTYAQLIPGVNHEVNVSGSTADYGVLILTYAVP